MRGWGRDGLGTGAQGRGREGAEGVDVDYALKDLPYGRWRTLDAEDSVRFFALRLHEAGMIKTSPQKFIAQGTDWRFLNEVKKELKG